MTDRELLEFAAKAAGIILEWDGPQDGWQAMYYEGKTYHGWDPLGDDGDALRLAVKLQLNVFNEHVNAGCAYCTGQDDDVFPDASSGNNEGEVIDEDYAATRIAIVLAAAEIGRLK